MSHRSSPLSATRRDKGGESVQPMSLGSRVLRSSAERRDVEYGSRPDHRQTENPSVGGLRTQCLAKASFAPRIERLPRAISRSRSIFEGDSIAVPPGVPVRIRLPAGIIGRPSTTTVTPCIDAGSSRCRLSEWRLAIILKISRGPRNHLSRRGELAPVALSARLTLFDPEPHIDRLHTAGATAQIEMTAVNHPRADRQKTRRRFSMLDSGLSLQDHRHPIADIVRGKKSDRLAEFFEIAREIVQVGIFEKHQPDLDLVVDQASGPIKRRLCRAERHRSIGAGRNNGFCEDELIDIDSGLFSMIPVVETHSDHQSSVGA